MTFTDDMYERLRSGTQASARIVCPRIDDLFMPTTVIDVGGGEGWWAAQFATDDRIPVVVDKEHPAITAPGVVRAEYISGHFDLALCLEVAEHLPESQAAELVGDLCETADVVVFSAAIPYQGGHGHLNEQWPEYWCDLFLAHGYACSEDLRWEFWNDPQVEPWYRQNLLVFASDLRLYPLVASRPLPVVHPDIYGWRLTERAELFARIEELGQ